MSARRIPTVLMRGGALRGLFFHAHDLPARPRARDALLLRAVGCPDPLGLQADGAGWASAEATRVAVVSRSQRPGVDVDFLCGAIAPGASAIDWTAPCGALVAAVAPFAVDERLFPADGGLARLRLRHLPDGTRIDAFVPVRDGEVVDAGAFVEDGVPFGSTEIRLEVIEPAVAAFPTGLTRETLTMPDAGPIDATLVAVGEPFVFVRADALGLSGREQPAELARRRRLSERVAAIAGEAAPRLGLGSGDAPPQLCWVATPAACRGGAADVSAGSVDLLLGRAPGVGRGPDDTASSLAAAVAAAVPGTVVSEVARTLPGVATRIGHALGTLAVGAEVSCHAGAAGAVRWRVDRCVLSRGARRLMTGILHVPSAA